MRFIIAIGILTLSFMMAGCRQQEPNIDFTYEEEGEDVILTIEQTSFDLSTDIIKATILNQSKSPISMGSDFAVEYFEKGQWVELPMSPNLVFTLELRSLDPGSSKNLEFWLEAFVTETFEFQAGLYRIRKSIFKEGDLEGKPHDLVAEFQLEEDLQ